MYLFGGIEEVGRWLHHSHSGRELNSKKEWMAALKSKRKQLTLRSVRRKGKGKEVILTERALYALDSAGHFHILYLIQLSQQPQGSKMRQVRKGEVAQQVCGEARVQTWASLDSELRLSHYIHLAGF